MSGTTEPKTRISCYNDVLHSQDGPGMAFADGQASHGLIVLMAWLAEEMIPPMASGGERGGLCGGSEDEGIARLELEREGKRKSIGK